MHMDLSVVDEVAVRQWGLITRAQLMALGFSRAQVATLIGTGFLVPIHPGVYRCQGAPPCWLQDALAVVLAAGPAAVASHDTAVGVHGLQTNWAHRLHATVAMTTSAVVRGATVHRTRSLEKQDLTVVSFVPVTSFPRTAIDLARTWPAGRLQWLVDRALVAGITTAEGMKEAIDRLGGGRHAMAKLLKIIERRLTEPAGMESTGQMEAYRILVDHGFPAPFVEFPIKDERGIVVARADLAFDVVTYDIEYDGRDAHFNPVANEADRQRDLVLDALGWKVSRITAIDIADPRRFLRAVAARFAEKGVPLPNVVIPD